MSLAIVFLASFIQVTDAETIERDWKTVGDGLLTLDQIGDREWLDLTETQGMSVPDVRAQLAPEGKYRGFRFASVEDVLELVGNAGLAVPSDSLPDRFDYSSEDVEPAQNLVELLGKTDDSYGFRISDGLALRSAPDDFVDIRVAWSTFTEPDLGGVGANLSPNDEHPELRGVWLFRPVPEPASLPLLGSALALLPICVRRFGQQRR